MWEQIRANRRRSAVLIAALTAVLVLVGYSAGELLAGPGRGPFGVLAAVVVLGILLLVYLTSAESILLDGAGARELKREDSPQLFNIVEEMKLASGLPFLPRLYLIDDPAPNAFAVGRKPDRSAIAVTSGLLQRLNRDELEGVIAHEIGHLHNRDVEFMTLAAVMLGTIVILSEIVRRSLWYGGRGRRRDDSREGGGQAQAIIMVVALVFAILGPVMAQLLYFACSRKREFLADACSAQFTRYPAGLAAALEKISQAGPGVAFASKVTAPMFIVNPLAADGQEAVSLFATHPPIAQRIAILRRMAGASLADYETAYHQAQHGSLIGTGSLASAPTQAIRAASAAGPIQARHELRQVSHRAHGYLRLKCNCGLEISVPEDYERDEIRCLHCGTMLPIPTADQPAPTAPPPTAAEAPPDAPAQPPLRYRRLGDGWESFRCQCGRTIQLSPSFAAAHIHCTGCGRSIEVV